MITQARLREVIHYNPETGEFTWRPPSRGRAWRGVLAGRPDKATGYGRIMIDARRYKAHQLAWLYMTGEWSIGIDHKNLDPGDNRWSNLREASHSQNCANKRVRTDSRSGIKGVKQDSRTGRWRADICVRGKSFCLGHRATQEEAAALYAEAARHHFGEFSRG